MNIDEQLRALPESTADPSALPSASAVLDERLKLLPAGDVSLQELVKDLEKENASGL